MSNEQIIESVRASFEMENLTMTNEDRERGFDILTGRKSIEQVIMELNHKYSHLKKQA